MLNHNCYSHTVRTNCVNILFKNVVKSLKFWKDFRLNYLLNQSLFSKRSKNRLLFFLKPKFFVCPKLKF